MLMTMALATASLLTGSADGEWQTGDVQLISIERNVIERVNDQRYRRGLRPLRIDSRLMRTARRHAAWMTRNRRLQHTREPVGENIAMGQRSSGQAVGDWMDSPGHRANILSRRYSRVGAAAYRTDNGTIYWCMQFLH